MTSTWEDWVRLMHKVFSNITNAGLMITVASFCIDFLIVLPFYYYYQKHHLEFPLILFSPFLLSFPYSIVYEAALYCSPRNVINSVLFVFFIICATVIEWHFLTDDSLFTLNASVQWFVAGMWELTVIVALFTFFTTSTHKETTSKEKQMTSFDLIIEVPDQKVLEK